MKDQSIDPIDIIKSTLGTFEHRQSFAPGMFEPLKPLFKRLGYESAVVYITDDYPDRMLLVTGYGGEEVFPPYVVLNHTKSLFDETARLFQDIPNLMLGRLFNHGRELGVLAVTCKEPPSGQAREAFDTLVGAVSIMAYVERIRTNSCRERQERDLFFAQSLTNRLMSREVPKVKNLRLGCEFMRTLEAGGDFYDFIPNPDGNLLGLIGSCSGRGLRTVMEMASILRETFRSFTYTSSLSEVLFRINTMLVEEKHRAHQASLCLFHVDATRRKLRLAKSGRLGILLCGPGGEITNLSAAGATFLGMVSKPDIHDDEYDFAPGQAFFCVTEGFYSSKGCADAGSQDACLVQSVRDTLEAKHKKPLANALFDRIGRDSGDPAEDNPVLALSVEFTGRGRESMRMESIRIRK